MKYHRLVVFVMWRARTPNTTVWWYYPVSLPYWCLVSKRIKKHRLVVLSLFVTILVSSKQENYKTPFGGFCRAAGVGAEYHRLVVFLARGRRGRGIPPFGGFLLCGRSGRRIPPFGGFCRAADVGVEYHRLVVLSLFVTILVSSKQEN